MPAKFVVKAAKDGQFYFNLVSEEGKKLLASEMYAAKASVFTGIASIKSHAREASRYERLTSADGKAFFHLKAANHEIIGVSDMYDTTDARDQALSKVMHGGPEAAIVEETAPKKASTKAEVTKTIEARKLNKRTMRPMSSEPVVIRFGSILQNVKEDDRRLLFEHLGEPYEADLSRAKGAFRMID